MVIHHTVTMLIVLVPHALITVVVEEVEGSTSMLLVLKPLPFVTLAITKGVGSCALTFAFYVVTLIDIPVFHHGTSLAIGLSTFQFARIDPTILEGVGTDIDALGSSWLPGHHVEQAAKELYDGSSHRRSD